MTETYALHIIDEETGLRFEWNRAHTVNVYYGETETDCISIGSFADNTATLDQFESSVSGYLQRASEEAHEEEWTDRARELGQDAARAAASWCRDGNETDEHVERMRAMFAEGDPAVDDYLPAMPDLSGEWADAPTPSSLARDITGSDESSGELVDALADAYLEGVNETFQQACEQEYAR
jgi:hypothetical protein